MEIIKVTLDNFSEWIDLALKLWPDTSMQEMEESLRKILQSSREAGFLIKNEQENVMGFINLSLRYDYVSGATQSPVAYIEGIYVKEQYRHQGVGQQLIQFAQQWGIEQGCIELASDALIENIISYEFHLKMGFQEVERIVTFIKSI